MELDYTTTDDGAILVTDLKVGDWYTLGSKLFKFYVYRVTEDKIYYSASSFRNSDGGCLLKVNFNKVGFLGKSKPNFWYKFFWWTDMVHPVKLIKN